MPANNIISRSDAQATIPEDVAKLIAGKLPEKSAAMRLFQRVPLSRNQQRIPVVSALPMAYFVTGDTGMKQTTEMAWSNLYLNVEELAAIVPIPESVLDDSDYDIFGAIRPRLEEAIGRAIDAAVFFGYNKPSSWPTDIVTAATAANNIVTRGTNAAGAGGLAQDISDVFSAVETDGYDVTGMVANRTYKGRLRSVRGTQGERLDEVNSNTAWDVDVVYAMRGLWPTGSAATELIAGDFENEGVFGVRQDMTYKVLTEGVIQDPVTGQILFNLGQQDMIALRVVFRCAWQVANVINYDNSDNASRYPFAVLKAPA